MDRVRTRIDESRRPALLLFEHDLREHDLRQVLACVAIDDLDGVAVTHQACNSFEGYVAAGLRVVELAIRILLDKVSLGGLGQCDPILMRCVMAGRTAS